MTGCGQQADHSPWTTLRVAHMPTGTTATLKNTDTTTQTKTPPTNPGQFNPLERRVCDESQAHTVKRRCKAGDTGGEQHTSAAQHTARLNECVCAIVGCGQVIKRPEHQHRIRARVRKRKLPRIAHGNRGERRVRLRGRGRDCRLDVRHVGVDQVNLIPLLRQGKGVGASRASNVEHDRRWCWQEAAEQFAGPDALQPSPGLQAVPLRIVPVVRSNRWIELLTPRPNAIGYGWECYSIPNPRSRSLSRSRCCSSSSSRCRCCSRTLSM